jgi:hypothetical protein
MGVKSYWLLALVLGLVLAAVSIPTSAYSMRLMFRAMQVNAYFAWSISAAVPAFLLMFPAGFWVSGRNLFLFGGSVGFVAVLGLILFSALDGFYPTPAFILEYVSLIIFSAIASHLGHLLRKKVNGARVD